MSQSLFQKELNDEIYVKDLGIDNPYPAALQVRMVSDGQVFSAAPGFVLKSIYSSLDSLDAFSSDGMSQVFVLYSRESGGKDAIFLQHAADPREETLVVMSVWDLPSEVQSYVPGNFR